MRAKQIKTVELKNGCILTINYPYRKRDGYAVIERNNRTIYLHRFIYEENFGIIPSGKIIRHLCNNSSCINPKHLACGTQKDNIRDEINRGTFVYGHHNGRSKLSPQKVREIRKDTIHTYKELGILYDIAASTAHKIRTGYSYRNII